MEEEQIKVSVIMPVYNPGCYLRPCLDSILGQTLKDIQVIAIDDCSTDGSWDILKEYAAKDTRLILLRNPYNIGAARTRNIGIQLARGNYISILDADDYFENDYLEVMYNECTAYDLDVAICGIWMVDEVNKSMQTSFVDSLFLEKVTKLFNYKDIKDYIFQIFIIAPFSKMVKRNFIANYSLEFQDVKYCNDVFWASVCLVHAERMKYINRHLIFYRYNTGRQISTHRGRTQYPVFMVIKKLRTWLEMVGKFEEVQQSYYSFSSILLNDNFSCADVESLKDGVEYWKSIGLRDAGLFGLISNHFISEVYYNRIESIKNGNIEHVKNDGWNKISVYKKFFEYLSSVSQNVGLWGFGKNGVEFYKEAMRQQFNIVEIYDNDEKKWSKTQVPIIKSFDDRSSVVDTIIVTNSRYWEEIVKEVKSRDTRLKVIDYYIYMWYGILRVV